MFDEIIKAVGDILNKVINNFNKTKLRIWKKESSFTKLSKLFTSLQ